MKRIPLLLSFGLCLVPLLGWRSMADEKLTFRQLESTLADMGYEVEEPTPTAAQITLAAGLRLPTRVTISKNGEKIWISVPLMTKEDADILTRGQLQAILQKNATIGPNYFVLDGGRLRMTRHIDNREMDSGILRKELDSFADHVSSTKELWGRKG